jgi:hypothetical protein
MIATEPPPMNGIARERPDAVCLAFLAEPRAARSLEAVRMALVVLAAAGHIAIDVTPGGDGFVRVHRAPGRAAPAHIVAIYDVLRDAARSGRLSRIAAREALTRAYGQRFRRYGASMVAPVLVALGLLSHETTRVLGLFPVRRLRRTPGGDECATRLARRLASLHALPHLLDRDPAAALRLARQAGPLLLLSPAARTALPRLQALGPAALAATAYALVDEPEPEWLDLFEHVEGVMTIEFDGLLDAIEAIAGFGTDGGSSADGDAGGGDGGGGGD